MDKYISNIFKRANIQKISSFLRTGDNEYINENKTYEERQTEAHEKMCSYIKWKFPNWQEHEAVLTEIMDYTYELEKIYTEIGMQCGAILTAELLHRPFNQDEDYE